jgi:hypothetical protein
MLATHSQYITDKAVRELGTLASMICPDPTDSRTNEGLENIRAIATRMLARKLEQLDPHNPVAAGVNTNPGKTVNFVELVGALQTSLELKAAENTEKITGTSSEQQEAFIDELRSAVRQISATAILFDPEIENLQISRAYSSWSGRSKDSANPVAVKFPGNEALKEVIDLIRSEKLLAFMSSHCINELQLEGTRADNSKIIDVVIKRESGEDEVGNSLEGSLSISTRYGNGQGVWTNSDNPRSFEDHICAAYFGSAYHQTEKILGFSIDQVWQGWFDNNNTSMLDRTAASLLYGLGYSLDPTAISSNFMSIQRSDYPIIKQEVLAGMKCMQENSFLVVDYGAFGGTKSKYTSSDWGPMDKERFNELYPQGVIGNDLLASWFSPTMGVVTPQTFFAEGHPPMPTEIMQIPVFLRDKGFKFDRDQDKWIPAAKN